MRKLLLLILLLCPALVDGAQFEANTGIARRIPEVTVATLPTGVVSGAIRIVTDGASNSDCTTGSGVARVLCNYNGSAWVSIGGGSFDAAGDFTVTGDWVFDTGSTLTVTASTVTMNHSQLSGLTSGDPHTQYVFSETSAGAPAAGSCDRSGQISTDTTNEIPYFCSDGAGGNPRSFATLGDAYNQVTGESGSGTASGNSTLNISCTPNCTTVGADASPDTLTITISDHVKSVFFPAAALLGDGTQCPATPTAVTINSGPKIYTFICTDNDASTLYGMAHMPDSWNGGTVTFSQSYIQTAADTSALNGDIAAQCRGNAETPSSTWGSEVAIDDAGVTGTNANDWTVSGAVTPAGTCAGGDMLYFRWQMDATGTTTAVATLHFLGFKMEYTVTGAGSD